MEDLFINLLASQPVLAFDIGALLQNAKDKVALWGGYAVMLIGAVCIVVAGYQIARGLMTQGKPGGGQTNWLVVILLLVVGGALAVGGYEILAQVASVGKDTVEQLAQEGSGGNGGTTTPTVVDWATSMRTFAFAFGII